MKGLDGPARRPLAAAALLTTLIGLLALLSETAAAQGVMDRTPNLEDGWTVAPGVVQFNFLHRFTVSEPPPRKVTSFPTFVFATGLPAGLAFGVKYATNSAVFEGIPNEYEIWLRRAVVSQRKGAPLDVALTAAYNAAAQSGDGELSLARRFGRLRLLAAARGMTSGYDTDRALWGAGGGLVVGITPWLALAGDLFTILNEEESVEDGVPVEDFDTAWGVGAQMAIPFTPHTFSIQVGNTNTASIQGASRGFSDEVTVGFEFTIPITLSRYFGGRHAPAAPDSARVGEEAQRPQPAAPAVAPAGGADSVAVPGVGAPAVPGEGVPAAPGVGAPAAPGAELGGPGHPEAGSVVEVPISNLAFGTPELRVEAGTRVRWVNRDPVQHTVSADDAGFESGLLDPGASFEHRFDGAGVYPYHCSPHPFMQARVIVE